VIVVVDTNVWISGLEFDKNRGKPTLALEKAANQDVIATCREIEDEIIRVLTEKFHWHSHHARAVLESMLLGSISVQLQGTVKLCRDPKDDIFLECAARSHADFLIAGDKDLLVLGQYKGTQIITPAQYIGLTK